MRNVYDRTARAGRARRFTLVILAGGCLSLVPWVGYLAGSLPDRFDTGQWRLAWVGFDMGLLCLWGAAGWLGWWRRPATVPVLDVMLDWRTADWTDSVALAVAVELPVAALLLTRARHLFPVADDPHCPLDGSHLQAAEDIARRLYAIGESTEAWRSQQRADDEIHEALPGHGLCPRLRARAGACRAQVTGHRSWW